MKITIRVQAGPRAAAEARHALDQLADYVDAEQVENITLLVSELVTNSVRHAGLANGEWIELSVVTSQRNIHVEVADQGPGFRARPRVTSADEGSGWGLFLVDKIASRWGIERRGETKVWFELEGPNHGSTGETGRGRPVAGGR